MGTDVYVYAYEGPPRIHQLIENILIRKRIV